MNLTRDDVLAWLKETDEEKLKSLYKKADDVRKEHVGDEVHLRGLIEFSNHCARQCTYCGLRADHKDVVRYRMDKDEILEAAKEAASYGYGTVVMQSGEDYHVTIDWMADVIKAIKDETGLAITLSLGERSLEELQRWRECGADRYLLRFETSNTDLFDEIHPPLNANKKINRLDVLKQLRQLGYEVGSGIMLGIPGQTYDDVANDIMLFKELDLDMIGVGPFIAHPDTPLGQKTEFAPEGEQVPPTEFMAYKVVALTRLLCPDTNIPSTTAIATLNKAKGRERGLSAGANVLMPNMTPRKYRALYEIYPAKACLDETAEECQSCMGMRIRMIGREPGKGRGDSPNATRRRTQN